MWAGKTNKTNKSNLMALWRNAKTASPTSCQSTADGWKAGAFSLFFPKVIDWLIDWLIGWLIDWLIGWLIDWLVDWLIGWLIDWLIDLSFVQGHLETGRPVAGDGQSVNSFKIERIPSTKYNWAMLLDGLAIRYRKTVASNRPLKYGHVY